MRYCVLASGSGGNATIVSQGSDSLLIDNGLSLKELRRRAAEVDVDLSSLRALFVTHEHGDHVGGAGVVARGLGIPVYMSEGTHRGSSRIWRGAESIHYLRAGVCETVAGFRVRPIAVSHDVREPLQFVIQAASSALGIVTDLGEADTRIEAALREVDAVVLESNHDLRMLLDGPYPWPLKQRVRGNRGHLSNEQCAELLGRILKGRCRQVTLAHLSRENNTPAQALAVNAAAVRGAGLADDCLRVAGQFAPGPWIEIGTQLDLLENCNA